MVREAQNTTIEDSKDGGAKDINTSINSINDQVSQLSKLEPKPLLSPLSQQLSHNNNLLQNKNIINPGGINDEIKDIRNLLDIILVLVATQKKL